jgi:hypothetical protein
MPLMGSVPEGKTSFCPHCGAFTNAQRERHCQMRRLPSNHGRYRFSQAFNLQACSSA